jgi:hypothetical protein
VSRTVLANVDGFTPVIDSMAREHGLVTAAVFGRMWRYCQGDRRVCTASLEIIGADLGLDRATAMRHAAKLVELGYLEDLTPDLRNRPHTYRDTGKAGLKANAGGVAESNTPVAQSKSSVAESEGTVAQRNSGVAESQLKRGIKKESKRGKETQGAHARARRGKKPKKKAEFMDNPAVVAFRDKFLVTPHPAARRAMAERVDDLVKWQAALDKWLIDRHNPQNVAGLLDFYQKGNSNSNGQGHIQGARGTGSSPHPGPRPSDPSPERIAADLELKRRRDAGR